MDIFSRFHDGSLDLLAVNHGWICLIPKKPAPTEVRDFRPISLVNGLSKIISKVLASRLQSVLEELINPFQTAFVRGRSLLDNFFMAHFLMHYLHSAKKQASLLKIDFERAFDQVWWPFLLQVLHVRGFSNIWIGWINAILVSSTSGVLLNGVPGQAFRCTRGLRQGDPLSPLLFILCIDVLFHMMQNMILRSLLPAVGIENCPVHSLQFADDLLLFFDGEVRSAWVIKEALDIFTAASGLRINYAKSAIIPVNMAHPEAATLANCFGCPLAGFPLKYLGLPLSPKALSRSEFLPIIEQLDNRLAG